MGPKWNAIRYTIEFVSGFSSCWSILGDTKYGGNKDLGLQLGEFDIIEDALVVPGGGSFDGKNVRCDGDADNFLHGQHGDGYRGYLVVVTNCVPYDWTWCGWNNRLVAS